MKFTEKDVLLKAASIVEEGWCQRTVHRDARGHTTALPERAVTSCAIGAVIRAVGQLGGDPTLYLEARERLMAQVGDDIGKWNDTPGRTAHEVAEAMRRAAE